MTAALMNPFKGLEPLGPGDVLFGRDADLTLVTDRVFRGKTTLLFAGSGVGKTSFFQAKFIPDITGRYREEMQVKFYNKWAGEDPLAGLRSALGAKPGQSLLQFFEGNAEKQATSWILVLDQFEELFTHHVYGPHFETFRDELCESINKTKASVRFVLSMREEFLGELSVFDSRVPDLFGNYYRLKNPDKKQAELIIRLTANKAGAAVNDEGLGALIDDLSKVEVDTGRNRNADEIRRDYVVPPHLQLVCRGLWDQEQVNGAPGSGQFEFLRDYVTSQGTGTQNPARQILQKFCEDQMDQLTSEQQVLAAQAFDFLVTSQGAKMSYELKSLARHMNTKEAVLGATLEKLSDPKTRILRKSQWRDELWFELYHDMYAPIMYEWKQRLDAKQEGVREREQRAGTCDRRAIQAEAKGNPDVALMFWLLAIEQRDTEQRRREAARLTWDVLALQRTFRHEGPVTAVSFGSRSGKIVTASTFRRTTAATGKGEARDSGGTDDQNNAEEFSLIQVWDPSSGNPVGVPFEVNAVIWMLELSPDENVVMAVGDGSLFRIDLIKEGKPGSWKIPRPRAPGGNRPSQVRFDEKGEGALIEFYSPVGRWIAVENANPKRSKSKLRPKRRNYKRMQASPDVKKIAGISPQGVEVLDAWTGKPVRALIPVKNGSALGFSADGEQLAVGTRRGTVQLWDLKGTKPLVSWACQGGPIQRIAFGVRGTIWVQSEPRARTGEGLRMQEWDVRGKRLGEAWDIAIQREPQRFWPRFSPAAGYIWDLRRISALWNIEKRKALEPVWVREQGTRIYWSRDDRCFLAAGSSGLARLWQSETLRAGVPMFADLSGSVVPALNKDGSRVAAVSRGGGVSIWTREGKIVCTVPATKEVRSLAFGPDGKLLAILHFNGLVQVWDIARTSKIAEAQVRNSYQLVFGSGGESLLIYGFGTNWWKFSEAKGRPKALPGSEVSCSSNLQAFVTYETYAEEFYAWNSTSAKKLGTFSHPEGPTAVAISEDGQFVLSAGEDGRAKLWSIGSSELRHELIHQGRVTAAAFSGSGKYIATLSDDLFARLWETADGNEIGRFRYERSADCVCFSPDDSSLLIATPRSLHLCKIEASGGLVPIASRQLAGRWAGNFSFLAPSGSRVAVLVQTAFQNWRAETIRFDMVEHQPIQGEIRRLQENWSLRTGLRYEGEEVAPVSVVRTPRTSNQKQLGKGNAESVRRQ